MEHRVREEETALAVGSGDMPVFSTPSLVALLENAAVGCVAAGLSAEDSSVGVSISIQHLRASAVGSLILGTARLTEISGRRLHFSVEAFEGDTLIAEGVHVRVVVERERFLKPIMPTNIEK